MNFIIKTKSKLFGSQIIKILNQKIEKIQLKRIKLLEIPRLLFIKMLTKVSSLIRTNKQTSNTILWINSKLNWKKREFPIEKD